MSSQSIINQDKLSRTPVRTFIKLILHGELSEIFRVFIQKVRTFFGLRLRVAAILRRRLSGLPIIGAWYQRKYLRDILAHYYDYKAPASGTNALKLAIIAHHADTKPKSSTFIRLISPLTSKSAAQTISLRLYPENTTKVEAKMHVCIVQRNVYDDIATAKKLVQNLRTNSVVLVVDSDDGFGEIDPTHPEHTTHQSRLQAYTYLLDEADQVWFSTEELKNSHPKIADKTYVVKNSIDKRVWGNGGSTSVPKDQPIQLLYMGTATHSADFAMILPALDAVAKKQPGSFVLNVIGVADDLPNLPWINRIVPEKGSMYPKFVQWFTDNNAFDVGLSPLVNSAFNRHKSDIKCLDYIAAGLLPVVSDVLPYQSPELDDLIVRVKNTKKDWEHALLELMKNKDATRQRAAKIIIQGQKYLQQKRTSDKTGKILLKRIEGLLED